MIAKRDLASEAIFVAVVLFPGETDFHMAILQLPLYLKSKKATIKNAFDCPCKSPQSHCRPDLSLGEMRILM